MDAAIAFSLRRAGLVALLALILAAAGFAAFVNLNIEAYPDPVPPLVEIVTQAPGQSAEEIERYVTIPIEVQMAGIPHVTAIRSISLFGLSDVKVQFTYDFTFPEAEQRVLNRLGQLGPLPQGAQPLISPQSPIGEIYRFRLVGPPGYSVMDLKTLADWVVLRRLKAVPGVIDVTNWGGKSKAYEVIVDRRKLVSYGVSIGQVIQAVNQGNLNVGGQTVNIGEQAAIVRGVGLIRSMADLRATSVATRNGSPVLLSDIAEVKIGHQPRLGIAGQDGDGDILEGVVLMQRGAESLPTIRAVEAEVRRINASDVLPPGVRIQPIYDRSTLIGLTTDTVIHNMVAGILLIFAIQWIFLGDVRSALIVSATVPFALAFALLIMTARGESANLLSIGAIDFGLIVDATVIMVENIYRNLAEHLPERQPTNAADAVRLRFVTIARAARQVNGAIFFAAIIIIVSFLPLFTLTGVEGHIFGPMARTYAYAIIGGLIATFTVTPALSMLLFRRRLDERETLAARSLRRAYQPALAWALDHRPVMLAGAATLALLTALGASQLGVEFLPKLEEGNLWIRATMPATISLEAGTPPVDRMRAVLKSFPEVVTVVSQHGRPDDGTDATGFYNAEFFVPLKPQDQWPGGVSKESLTQSMQKALVDRFPGVSFDFSQTIESNVEEAASGVKGANSIKLFGPDLAQLQETAVQIRNAIVRVPGITDVSVLPPLGQPTVRIDVDRAKAARYGLGTADINAVVQAAIGGSAAAANLFEPGSDRNFPIVVRLAAEQRGSIDSIRRIPVIVPSPTGSGTAAVDLQDLADVHFATGASFVYREGQARYVPIAFSVRGRDLGGAITDAQAAVAKGVRVPPGYHTEWVGELTSLQDAIHRLQIVVPLSLAIIVFLLFLHFSSIGQTAIAASVIPMATIGGIVSLLLTGTPFSVSAAIGFIALFGISVTGGLVVVGQYRVRVAEGAGRIRAAFDAGTGQLRPVVMTCVVAALGLLPAAVSSGIGSQVQKPLAIVVVGGVLLAPVFILLLVPVLLALLPVPARNDRPDPAMELMRHT
ncbi:MAG: CusA/CzcA family heavy metal efflux RND transporter [Sphingomonadaceae bacterium]|nr:CusA/CzcA family heavy metal efflux RND transporter [Sphingomonadaceae bacterium]